MRYLRATLRKPTHKVITCPYLYYMYDKPSCQAYHPICFFHFTTALAIPSAAFF